MLHRFARRMASTLLAIGWCCTADVALADMTIQQYLAIEKGEAGVRPDFSMVYLAGVLAGLQAANGIASAEGRPIFCPGSRSRSASVVELKPGIDAAIAKAVDEQPGFDRYARIMTVGMVGLSAMTSLYPCRDTPEPAAGQSTPAPDQPIR